MQGFFDNKDGCFKVEIEVSGTTPNLNKKVIALFDTGHNGTLSLPIFTLIEVGAKFKSYGPVTYASGYGGVNYYFEVDVTMDGNKKSILASMIENPNASEAIAGVQLFDPYITAIDFKNKAMWITTKDELDKLSAKPKP